jgi:hypothetical protein
MASTSFEVGQKYILNPQADLPALHPGFSIPTVPDGGNHTREFTRSAALVEAHKQCLIVSIALAGAGLRVLTDDTFFSEVIITNLVID